MNIKIKPIQKIADEVTITLSFVDTHRADFSVMLKGDGIMELKNIIIQGPEYDAWGTDDNYIYDLVLQKLGYERA
jgi:hypothetical protein